MTQGKMRRMGGQELNGWIGRLQASLIIFLFLTVLLSLVKSVELKDTSPGKVRKQLKVEGKGEPVSVRKMPFNSKSLQKLKSLSLSACPPNPKSNSTLKCRQRKKQHEKLRKSDITRVFKNTKTMKLSKDNYSKSKLDSYLAPFNIDHRDFSVKRDRVYVNSKNRLPPVPKSLLNVKKLTAKNLQEINKFIREKRKICKLRRFEGFSCQKFKFSTWLAKQFDKNITKVTSWLEIVKRTDDELQKRSSSSSLSKDLSDVKPEFWPEKIVFRLIRAWGDPEDLFIFYKYKDYVNSRELKISLPYQAHLKVSPRTGIHTKNELEQSARSSFPKGSVEQARIFWDPGFNLKLKLPFFRDELKVAVSTGPSFVAGIGVGIAILIMKSMFAPFLLGMKWLMYNVFFKESSPFDLMKMFFLSHAPDSWDPPIPPPSLDHYRPPPVHNHYDHHHRPPPPPPRHHTRPFRGPPPPPRHHYPSYFPPPFRVKNHGAPPPPPPHHHVPYGAPTSPGPSYEFDYPHDSPPPFDMKYQFSDSTPMVHPFDDVNDSGGVNPTISQLEQLYRAQLLEEGLGLKRPSYKSLLEPDPTNSLDMGETDSPQIMDSMMDINMDQDHNHHHDDTQSYIPSTGLQAEVEHFDPFYSPLLSKIDSIFTHLGHNDEGCRERVVCSIYKFPVKYAPYSNLISAQLSKHQSELKRPVTPSPKILRYFRYMKAAKDGQAGENCGDLYPKCNSDTDSVSSLPMITTFHQLSELMTAESSSPAVALASGG